MSAYASTRSMRRTRTSARAFTLVELMVSLVAGLIVTIAVVGLARAATTTFFEAARISSVEASVRTAAERLRQDLSRASYMSTGNIKLACDQALGVPLAHRIAVPDPTNLTVTGGSRFNALNDLAGINIVVGGSGATPIADAGTAGPNALSVNNGLNPDAVILGGNYTTNDSYQGTFASTGGSCGGQSVTLTAAADAAVRRLVVTADPLASTQAAFTPVPGTRFAARVVDARGCQHFVTVCGVTATTAGAVISIAPDSGGKAGVMVSGDPLNPSKTNCGAVNGEPVTINPVQRVRWFIGPNTDASLDPASGVEVAGNKFNLYRDLIDAEDPPKPVLATRQIVAEYAVDLKFGIAVANALNKLDVYDMEDATGGVAQYTKLPSGTAPGSGPQRVRSVRFRLVTRAAVPDRNTQMAIGLGPYLTRYCVQNQPPATCKNFARARTVVSEVALMNQLGMTY